jgi:putative NADH-flavin reductase
MKIKAIITGATGMVGEGVLLECLNHPDVEEVLVINRRTLGMLHPKLTEIIHQDFFNLAPIESQLSGYNACYFCLGVSSIGLDKQQYEHFTYDLTIHVNETLAKLNPDMTICYVTGAGTDINSKQHWARVKGATENKLLELFKNAYMFRPAFMKATKGQKNLKSWYKLLSWMYYPGRAIYPSGFLTLKEVGLAMINVTSRGYSKPHIEVKDILILSRL